MALQFVENTEATVIDVVKNYSEQGFTGDFSARPDGMVRCHSCGSDEPSEQMALEALHRFEGVADPADEACVAAVECPACGEWGTLVMGYGPSASPEDASVLANFIDDRDHSRIRSGT